MRYFNNFDAFMKLVLSMKDGFGNTLMIFFFTLLFSLPLGLAVALLRMSRRKIISRYRIITTAQPMKPIVSPMEEKMKSVWSCGT